LKLEFELILSLTRPSNSFQKMTFPSKAFLSILFVVLSSVDASPLSPVTGKASLTFTARVNARGAVNVAAADRARAQAMKQAGYIDKRAGKSSFDITNAVVTYTANVGVGSPATECKIDRQLAQMISD
jgi:pepsin A